MMMMMEEGNGSVPERREFLAIVLAGFGNELVPLTNDHDNHPSLKCLLPIGNKAMIDYTLEWLLPSSQSIPSVLIICPTIHRQTLSHHLHSNLSPALSSLHIELQTYDETPENPVGTCVLLRHVAKSIGSEDVVVLPCDFIPPPSLDLSTLLNRFRVDGSLATSTWFAPAEKEGEGDEGKSPIVWDEKMGRLLHVDSLDDQDRNSEEVQLRMSILSKHPRARMSKKYQDSHVYVCKRSVLDVLAMKTHFDSFREEFLPWLCSIQHASKAKKAKYAAILGKTNTQSQDTALRRSTTYNILTPTPTNLDDDDEEEEKALEPTYSIGLVLHRGPETASRINTLPALIDINRQAASKATWVLPSDPSNRSLIDQKAQISTDSIVGDSTQISERATIKKSVIGRHCVIGKMVRIVGCVLMDHCVVEDGAKVDYCMLGTDTRVGEKAEVSKCVTQPGYQVGKGVSVKGEKLESSDWTEGAQDDEESDGSGSEEGTVQEDDDSD